VNRKTLVEQLTKASIGLSPTGELQQSDCFVFRNHNVHTFNDEILVSVLCDLEIIGAVPAKALLELLKKLSDDDLIFETDDKSLRIKGKGKRASVVLQSEIVLPIDMVEKPKDMEWFTLPEKFFEAVQFVGSCTSRDAEYAILACVHVTPDWVEASNGYQAARYKLKQTGLTESILIPWKSLGKIVSSFPTNELVEFAVTDEWVHFRDTHGTIISCVQELKRFLDLSQPLNWSGTPITLPSDVSKMVSTASVFASMGDSDIPFIRVRLREGGIEVKGENEFGSFAERKKADYKGEDISFNVAPKLLNEIAKKSAKCEITKGKLKAQTKEWVYVACTWVESRNELHSDE